MVLEKTLESPLDFREIQPVHPKGDQSWVFIERTDVEAESPVLWPPECFLNIGLPSDFDVVWIPKGYCSWSMACWLIVPILLYTKVLLKSIARAKIQESFWLSP